jgi:Yip1 domain
MNLIERAKNMIITPKTEWNAVAAETPNTQGIIIGYVVPLAAIGAIATFIKYGFIGVDAIFFKMKGVNWGLSTGITAFISAIAGVFVAAFVADMLAPSFGSEKNMGRSVQLVAYSTTPSWIAGVLVLIPFLGILGMIAGGIYGIYLMYLGLGPIKKTPDDKKVVYLVVIILVAIVAGWIFNMLLAMILNPIFGAVTPTVDSLKDFKISF